MIPAPGSRRCGVRPSIRRARTMPPPVCGSPPVDFEVRPRASLGADEHPGAVWFVTACWTLARLSRSAADRPLPQPRRREARSALLDARVAARDDGGRDHEGKALGPSACPTIPSRRSAAIQLRLFNQRRRGPWAMVAVHQRPVDLQNGAGEMRCRPCRRCRCRHPAARHGSERSTTIASYAQIGWPARCGVSVTNAWVGRGVARRCEERPKSPCSDRRRADVTTLS